MKNPALLLALGVSALLAALLSCAAADDDANPAPPTAEPSVQTESRQALRELIATLEEIDARWLGPEGGITRPGDVSDGHRALMHILLSGLDLQFEADPERPVFQRLVTPKRKFLGDNPDAVYYGTAIDPDGEYRIRGNTGGATYISITVEGGTKDGHYPTRTLGAINDTEFEVDSNGDFEIILSRREYPGDWLKLEDGAGSLTTRHYFEDIQSAAADPTKKPLVTIERLTPLPPPPTPDDASIAAAIRRVTTWIREQTLEGPSRDPEKLPSWVSTVPNQFNPPETPSDMGFAAMDNAYTMAPYVLGPDQALVIEGRFPEARFVNVALWNRYLQTYDYAHRQISLNRKQTQLLPDGSFRIVVAHEDPGLPNWLDTEGRPSGILYWRFLLPEGEIETPKTRVVPLADLEK